MILGKMLKIQNYVIYYSILYFKHGGQCRMVIFNKDNLKDIIKY